MASFVPPKVSTQFIFYVSLVSQANTKLMQVNPTIASGDFKVSIDGAALANLGTLPVVAPAGSTMVKITLSTSEMAGANATVVCLDAAGSEWCDLTVNIQTATRQIDDLAYPATTGRSMVVDASGLVDANMVKAGASGSGNTITTSGGVTLPAATLASTTNITAATGVDITKILGTAISTPATAGILDVNVKNIDNDAASASGTVTFPNATLASTTNISAGTITTSTNVTNISSGGITRASLAADTGLQSIRSNTAQSGGGTSITLDASASAVNDFYKNALIILTGGTGVGQGRFCTAYNGTTKTATVTTWATNPDNTSTFAIMAFDAIVGATAPTAAQVATAVWTDLLAGSDFSTSASVGKLIKDDVDTTISSRLAPTVASRTLNVNASGLADVDVQTIKTNPVVNAGTITFPTTATLASTTNITAGTVTTATNVTTVNGLAANVITAASIADAAIDRATFAPDTGLQCIRANTATAGGATTITLDASASATNDFYKNDLILLTGGTAVGQARFITGYVGATKVATVATWAANPDNTTTFAILPFDSVPGATAPTAVAVATAVWTDLLASSDFSTASSIGKLLKDDIDAAISSRMATYTQPTGFLAATFPSGTVANTTNITAATGIDVTKWLGSGVSVPTAAGVPNVNAKTWNDLVTVALPLVPTTAGRTLDVSAGGEGGVDWANVGSPTTTLNLSATTIKTTTDIATQIGSNGSGLTSVGVGAGGIAASSFAAGAIDAAAIATDAIGSAELSAAAVTKITAGNFAFAFPAAYGNYTFTQLTEMMAAALLAKCSGMATATGTFRNLNDSADVIVATIDASGNRTGVSLTP